MSSKYGDILDTEAGQLLYSKWNKIHQSPHEEAFDDFLRFYDWAMKSGYEEGMTLKRVNCDYPYGPENCYFDNKGVTKIYGEWAEDFVKDWNRTVNVLRRHFGLEPLEVIREDVL